MAMEVDFVGGNHDLEVTLKRDKRVYRRKVLNGDEEMCLERLRRVVGDLAQRGCSEPGTGDMSVCPICHARAETSPILVGPQFWICVMRKNV